MGSVESKRYFPSAAGSQHQPFAVGVDVLDEDVFRQLDFVAAFFAFDGGVVGVDI